MKNFNQLVNESSGLKLTRDYNRFLLEQQAFVAQKTCAILFGEETDYDGSDDKSNDPPFNSHLSGQFYAHINMDGTRQVRTFNTAKEAALVIEKYPGSVIYNFKGDIVNPNQVESVQRFNIFEDEAKTTKSVLSDTMPETYKTLRAKLEKDIETNIDNLIRSEELIVGKGKVTRDSVKQQAKWKAIYDDPDLYAVLDVEEYAHGDYGMGAYNKPLYIRKRGESFYEPREVDADISDVKEPSRKYVSGQAEGPPNPEDMPDIKFISPAHPNFEAESGTKQAMVLAKDWYSQPENIKSTLAAGAGIGAGMALAKTLIPKIPVIGPTITPWVTSAAGQALAWLYGADASDRMDQEIDQSLKGKSVTAGRKTATEVVAGEIPVAAAGAKMGGSPFSSGTSMNAKGRVRPSSASVATPVVRPTPSKPESAFPDAKTINQQIAQQQAMSWNNFRKFELPKTVDAFEKMSPDQQAALQKQGEALFGSKPTPDLIPDSPWKRPGLPGSRVRNVDGGSSTYRRIPSAKDAERLLKSTHLTDAERNSILRASQQRLGQAIGGKVGERVSDKSTELEQQVLDLLASMDVPPEQITPELLAQTRRNLGVSGTEATDVPVTPGRDPKYRGFKLGDAITPPPLPQRPASYQGEEAYKKAKEEQLGRKLTDEESQIAAKEYNTDGAALDLSRNKNQGNVAMSTGAPSGRASFITQPTKSPVVKALGVAASIPTVANASTGIPDVIPAIVSSLADTTTKSPKADGPLRLAYKETQAPTKAKPSSVDVKPTASPRPAPSRPQILITPQSSGGMNQPMDINDYPREEENTQVTQRATPAPSRDSWKPAPSIAPMTVSGDGAPPPQRRSPELPQKPETFRVTPTPQPVDRASIDSFVKSLIPSAANRPSPSRDSWKPAPSIAPMTVSGDGAPPPQRRSPELPQKPETFRVTPTPQPVDRASIDNLLVNMMPTASNRPAPPTDSWKPSRSQEPMTQQSGGGGGGGGPQTPPSFKGQENFRVTPTPQPVDRTSIDAFIKAIMPGAGAGGNKTQGSVKVDSKTTSPTSPSTPTSVPDVSQSFTQTPASAETPVQVPASTKAEAEAPANIPDTAPVDIPDTVDIPDITPADDQSTVNKVVQSIIAAATIGGTALLPGKIGGGRGKGEGGGGGGGMGGSPADREELKRQQQELDSKAKNWDLLIKNIWGKNVETLTK